MTKQEKKLIKKLEKYDSMNDGIETLIIEYLIIRYCNIPDFKNDVILLRAYRAMFLES